MRERFHRYSTRKQISGGKFERRQKGELDKARGGHFFSAYPDQQILIRERADTYQRLCANKKSLTVDVLQWSWLHSIMLSLMTSSQRYKVYLTSWRGSSASNRRVFNGTEELRESVIICH